MFNFTNNTFAKLAETVKKCCLEEADAKLQIKHLKEKIALLKKQLRALINTAKEANAKFTAENSKLAKAEASLDGLRSQVEALAVKRAESMEDVNKVKNEMSSLVDELSGLAGKSAEVEEEADAEEKEDAEEKAEGEAEDKEEVKEEEESEEEKEAEEKAAEEAEEKKE